MDINAQAKKRLVALIEERGSPLAPLAAKIGVSQSTLWNFIYGHTKNFSRIHGLATELKVSLDWILNGDVSTPPRETKHKTTYLSENLPDPESSYPPGASIPVLGKPKGVLDAIDINWQEKIGDTARHPGQKNVKDAFAVYVTGEAMSPRYRSGEMVYVAAQKPPVKGQDCIVELANGESYLREFVARKEDRVICKQLNPQKTLDWRMKAVKAVHAVVGRG